MSMKEIKKRAKKLVNLAKNPRMKKCKKRILQREMIFPTRGNLIPTRANNSLSKKIIKAALRTRNNILIKSVTNKKSRPRC